MTEAKIKHNMEYNRERVKIKARRVKVKLKLEK
jgi:hypothetical protein